MVKMVDAVSKQPLLPKKPLNYANLNEGVFETKLLESTVDKITSLLRVCFGEAGAGIISSNLDTQRAGSTSSVINPLIPGVRVYAIVGFCDIHHFEEGIIIVPDLLLILSKTIYLFIT